MAADDDGLTLPEGFSATVVQEGLGAGRHLAVAANGNIYLAGRDGLVAMRDKDGDGKAEETQKFGDVQGTEVRLFKNWLYVSDNVGVYRYKLKKGELAPASARQVVVDGFPMERQHADKTFALDTKGTVYVNVGAPSNSCQEKDRQEGSLGLNPCPILEKYGGVWVFARNKLNQKATDGRRFATGMRNAVAIEWNAPQNALFAVIQGRDAIDTLFPALYNAEDNATRQAEEFHKITDGGDYGWPYTFWDTKAREARGRARVRRRWQEGARSRQVPGAARGLSRALGAQRSPLLFRQEFPGEVPGRGVHSVPRELESCTRTAGWLQGGVPADEERQAQRSPTKCSPTDSPVRWRTTILAMRVIAR
jgi:glucose/arabinose dehydrogenase